MHVRYGSQWHWLVATVTFSSVKGIFNYYIITKWPEYETPSFHLFALVQFWWPSPTPPWTFKIYINTHPPLTTLNHLLWSAPIGWMPRKSTYKKNRTHNQLFCKQTHKCTVQTVLITQLNHLASLVKCLSVRLRTKWLWVQIQLQSLKLQILRLFQARSSLSFRQV